MSRLDPGPLVAVLPTEPAPYVARTLGVHESTVRYWRLGRRRLSAPMADRVAIRLGLHPSLIWPDWEAA